MISFNTFNDYMLVDTGPHVSHQYCMLCAPGGEKLSLKQNVDYLFFVVQSVCVKGRFGCLVKWCCTSSIVNDEGLISCHLCCG